MKIKVLLLSAFLVLLCGSFSALAAVDFPIEEDFSGVQPAEWGLTSDAVWNTTVNGDQSLRLTSADIDQSGLGFYDESFSSEEGIVAEFKYYAGAGNGADGLAFFLVDGDLVNSGNITAGAFGGALGYAQSDAPNDGIPHAYLGVGFDEFGNFSSSNGGKSGGTVFGVPDNVTLRGSGNGTTGYEFLTSTDVFDLVGQRIDGGWRVARVTVLPGETNAVVRVEMSWNDGSTWHTIIDDFVYNEAPPENLKLGFTGSTGGSTNIHAIGELEVVVPVDLDTTVTVPPAGSFSRGETADYAYTITNNGPNDATAITITNAIPIGDDGFNSISWTHTASGTGLVVAGDETDISPMSVSIPNGETLTVEVSPVIGDAVVDTTDLDHTISVSLEYGADPSPNAPLQITVETDVPTVAEDALERIDEYATTNGASAAPAVQDYTDVGVTGVTADNLDETNAAVSAADGVGSILAIQNIADLVVATGKIGEYSNTGGASTTPTLDDYSDAGVTGVTADNLADINESVASGNVGSVEEIQTTVNTTVAIIKIDQYADTNGASPEPTVNDYDNAGVSGVTEQNVDEVNAAIAESGETGVENIRAIVGNTVARLNSSVRSGGSVQNQISNLQKAGNHARATDLMNKWPNLYSTEDVILILRAQLNALLVQYKKLVGTDYVPIVVNDERSTRIRDLEIGTEGDDVRRLQELLMQENTGPSAIKLEDIGTTGYFGIHTASALTEYQRQNNIFPASGYFGPITRMQMKVAEIEGLWW